ncbi:MAG TPA: hypothetical protein VFQ54_08805 [Thermomicrobiales bacterium]|nr:hypothetical protein [Thermomicrobiales bacterium]
MDSVTIVVGILCAMMAAIGLVIARISKKDRGAGLLIVVVAVAILVFFHAAPDRPPLPGSGTPSPDVPFSFPIKTNP